MALAIDYADAVMPSYELSANDLMTNIRTLTETIDLEKKTPTLIIHSDGLIPWMQSDFCAAGRNQKPCNYCSGQSVFEMQPRKKGEETKLTVIPHPVDCSCAIYGRAKNMIGQEYADAIADMGFNVICNYTILPGGNDND